MFLQYAQIFAVGEKSAQALGVNAGPIGLARLGWGKADKQGNARQGLSRAKGACRPLSLDQLLRDLAAQGADIRVVAVA